MEPLQVRIEAIQNSFPDLILPPDLFDEFEQLRAARNALNDERNGILGQLNRVIVAHNQATEERNASIVELNELFDKLAWLP
jgi:DNA-binding FrmR family transcriptional regulator